MTRRVEGQFDHFLLARGYPIEVTRFRSFVARISDLGADLLVMEAPTQQHWLHQVPQRLRVSQPRLNLTFRLIRPEALRSVGPNSHAPST